MTYELIFSLIIYFDKYDNDETKKLFQGKLFLNGRSIHTILSF